MASSLPTRSTRWGSTTASLTVFRLSDQGWLSRRAMDAGAAWGEACLAALLDQAEMEGRSRGRAVVVVRRLVSFASAQGIAPVPGQLFDHDVIEAFCVQGLTGCSSSTRGTYRSVLDTLAAFTHGPPPQRGTPFPGARAPAPYTPWQRAELVAMAGAQPQPA